MKRYVITLLVVILSLFLVGNLSTKVDAYEEAKTVFDYKTNDAKWITYSSSIESDFNHLQINYDGLKDKLDPEILTFANGYLENSEYIPDAYYVYYYFPSLERYGKFNHNDGFTFTAATISHKEYQKADTDNDGFKTYFTRLISGTTVYDEDNNPRYIIKAYIQNFNDDYKLFESNKIVYIKSYEFSKVVNGNVSYFTFDDVKHFFEFKREIQENMLLWSCASINNYWVELKGVLGYFTFDSSDSFKHGKEHSNIRYFDERLYDEIDKIDYMHNDLDLFYVFFDIYKYGELLDFTSKTKYITEIHYDITEYINKNISHYELRRGSLIASSDNYLLTSQREKRYQLTDTYSDIVRNENYLITVKNLGVFPLINLYSKGLDISKAGIEYQGIWKTTDAGFEEGLKTAGGYDHKLFKDYSYATRVGLPEGYGRTKIKEKVTARLPWQKRQYDIIELSYDLDVTFKKIYYMDAGKLCDVSIDRQSIINIGFIGDADDIVKAKIPFTQAPPRDEKWGFWNYVKLLLVIILLLPILKLLISILSLFFGRGGGNNGPGLLGRLFGRRGNSPYNKRKRVRIVEKKSGKKIIYINENVRGAGFAPSPNGFAGNRDNSLIEVNKPDRVVNNTYHINNTDSRKLESNNQKKTSKDAKVKKLNISNKAKIRAASEISSLPPTPPFKKHVVPSEPKKEQKVNHFVNGDLAVKKRAEEEFKANPKAYIKPEVDRELTQAEKNLLYDFYAKIK